MRVGLAFVNDGQEFRCRVASDDQRSCSTARPVAIAGVERREEGEVWERMSCDVRVKGAHAAASC